MIWSRTLRTTQSERFHGVGAVAIDLHSMTDGTVAGTVTLLASAKFEDDLLSGVNLTSGNLTFPVIRGKVLSNTAETDKKLAPKQ